MIEGGCSLELGGYEVWRLEFADLVWYCIRSFSLLVFSSHSVNLWSTFARRCGFYLPVSHLVHFFGDFLLAWDSCMPPAAWGSCATYAV